MTDVNAETLLATTDAQVWAKAFVKKNGPCVHCNRPLDRCKGKGCCPDCNHTRLIPVECG